jgi:hypothetical protein
VNEREIDRALLRWLEKLWRDFIEFIERRPQYTLHLETGESMTTQPDSNYQLTEGDSVVITITITDDQTGATVTADPGSVTAVSTNPNDTVVVDPSQTFVTLTASDALNTDQLLTVNATVGGVAVGPTGGAVFEYDVVAPVTPPASYTMTLTAGVETAPTPGNVGTEVGQINPVTGQVNT